MKTSPIIDRAIARAIIFDETRYSGGATFDGDAHSSFARAYVFASRGVRI